MKAILQSEQDVSNLSGKWIIQLNSDQPDEQLNDTNWKFIKEKRLYLVLGLRMINLCANRFAPITHFEHWEKFASYFNHYIGNKIDKRFHRLLTSDEIDFLSSKFKEERNKI